MCGKGKISVRYRRLTVITRMIVSDNKLFAIGMNGKFHYFFGS